MQDYLLQLLSCAVRNIPPTNPPTDINWSDFYNCAIKQQVFLLIYPLILELPENLQPAQALIVGWKSVAINASLKYSFYFSNFNGLLNQLEIHALPVTLLKGAITRDLYPTPEYRTMGDIDILVAKEYFFNVSDFLVTYGYTRTITKDTEHTFKKEGALQLELFTDLELGEFEMQYGNEYRASLQPYKDFKYITALSNEWQIVHWTTHLAKHFVGRGTGIRNLADLYLLLTQYNNALDMELLNSYLYCLGVSKFHKVCVCIINNYFNTDFPTSVSDDMLAERTLSYLLSLGIYGDNSIGAAGIAHVKKFGYMKGIATLLFPSYTPMKISYKYLQKLPILLPFAYIWRILTIIFHSKKLGHRISRVLKSKNQLMNDNLKLQKDLELKG